MSMMRGRPVRDEADARACLAQVQTAPSLNAWCRTNGVSVASLHGWKRRLDAAEQPQVRWVEVTLPQRMPSRYEVVLEGATVVVSDDFREDTLKRLRGVLTSC